MDEGFLYSALVIRSKVTDHRYGIKDLEQLLVLPVYFLYKIAVQLDRFFEGDLYPAVLDEVFHLFVNVLLELLLEAVQRFCEF